jgi:elongation factor Ts
MNMEFSAQQLKTLRETTGAGWTHCKSALIAAAGDTDKAIEWLRQRGIALSEKRIGNAAAEGCIFSYIHNGGYIGVLVEVNCETDFVARCEDFRDLVRNIAMQIAACPSVSYVSIEDVPESVVTKEREIEMGRDDLSNKKEEFRERIIEGRVAKNIKDMVLLEQPYIRDSGITVGNLVRQVSGKLKENIVIRRFCRYQLGTSHE